MLLILTDVPQAYINYNTPEQEALGTVTLSEMRAHAAAGHFKAGSMGPKVDACMRFVAAGGTAVIASLTEVVAAMNGEAGRGSCRTPVGAHAETSGAGKDRGPGTLRSGAQEGRDRAVRGR